MKLNVKHLLLLLTILFSLYNFLPISEHSAQAKNTKEEWKPKGALSSIYLGNHLYQYTSYLGGLKGIYSDRGYVLYHPQFTNIVEIPSSCLAVERNGLWGVLDDKGIIVIPIEYDNISQLNYSTSRVQKGAYYGWINNCGKFVKTPQYVYLEKLGTDLISVCSQDSGCGVLTPTGNEFIPLKYDGIFGSLSRYYFSFYKNGRYGIVDINGNSVVDCKFSDIYGADENVIYTKDGKQRGLASIQDGRIILEPVYDNIVDLEQAGYYKIKNNGKWGVVDYDGNIIYPCKYGPLEINRMMKKYPVNTKYQDLYAYNLYSSKLLTAEYFLKLGLAGIDAKKNLNSVLSSENKFNDLKQNAYKLLEKYGLNSTFLE